MSDFPRFVEFREEGPREGFQIEKEIYPIEQRTELIDIDRLIAALTAESL